MYYGYVVVGCFTFEKKSKLFESRSLLLNRFKTKRDSYQKIIFFSGSNFPAFLI